MFPISAIAGSGISAPGLQPGMGAALPQLPMGEAGTFPIDLGKATGIGMPDSTSGVSHPSFHPGITGTQPSDDAFSKTLNNFVQEVNSKQAAAGDAVSRLQSGGDVSLHQAVIAMEEANVSFQLMVEVRNKLLEGYQEIMRMQI